MCNPYSSLNRNIKNYWSHPVNCIASMIKVTDYFPGQLPLSVKAIWLDIYISIKYTIEISDQIEKPETNDRYLQNAINQAIEKLNERRKLAQHLREKVFSNS